MDKDIVSMANQFDFYDKLGWYYRWKFRRHLSWLGQDLVSLGYLLEFEQELKKKSFPTFRIVEILEDILRRYHKEEQANSLPNRIPRERLPDMLQVMLVFYSKSRRLHRSSRELILSILQAEEQVRAHHATGSGIPAEQFRVEIIKAILNLSTDWGKGNEVSLKNRANYLLPYLTNIARNVSDLDMFTQFQQEAEKFFARLGGGAVVVLRHLEAISIKVSDMQTSSVVFQEIVPVLGLETTASLLGICKGFQEFEVYYPRIQEQLRWWRSDYSRLFIRPKNTSGLDQLLGFLETLAKHERMTKYIHYPQVQHSGTLLKHISDALHTHKDQVYHACLDHNWEQVSKDEQLMDGLIDQFEQTIVNNYLNTTWSSAFPSGKIRWEFSKFTNSIPVEIMSWKWTQDNDKARSYWNWTDAAGQEHDQYNKTLGPLLLPLCQKLEFSEIGALFDLFPQYLGIQAFKKTVKVPVEWEMGSEYQEAYNKWAGHYTQEITVARPKSFVDHTFTFERPNLQKALTLLNNMDKVYEAIQAYQKF